MALTDARRLAVSVIASNNAALLLAEITVACAAVAMPVTVTAVARPIADALPTETTALTSASAAAESLMAAKVATLLLA